MRVDGTVDWRQDVPQTLNTGNRVRVKLGPHAGKVGIIHKRNGSDDLMIRLDNEQLWEIWRNAATFLTSLEPHEQKGKKWRTPLGQLELLPESKQSTEIKVNERSGLMSEPAEATVPITLYQTYKLLSIKLKQEGLPANEADTWLTSPDVITSNGSNEDRFNTTWTLSVRPQRMIAKYGSRASKPRWLTTLKPSSRPCWMQWTDEVTEYQNTHSGEKMGHGWNMSHSYSLYFYHTHAERGALPPKTGWIQGEISKRRGWTPPTLEY